MDPATKDPLARSDFLHAGNSFPQHGLLTSSSGVNSSSAPRAVLALASAAAKGWLLVVSSIQEGPKAESGMLDPSDAGPTLLGAMVISETAAFPTQGLPAAESPLTLLLPLPGRLQMVPSD